MLIRTFVLVISVLSIFLFGGCDKNNDVFILKQFESEIDITAKNTEYKGTVFFNGEDSTSFIFSQPETMEGISAISDKNGTRYILDDVVCNVQPDDNHLFLLNNILLDMKNNIIYTNKVNSFSCGDENYEVIIGGDNCTDVTIACAQYRYSFSVV